MPITFQSVPSGEDLHHFVGEREIRVSDARRGQRADGEVEPVGHAPALAEGIRDRLPADTRMSAAPTMAPKFSSLAASGDHPNKPRNMSATDSTV